MNKPVESLSRAELIRYRGYRKDIVGDKFSLYISNYPVNARYLLDRIGNPERILAELCCSVGVTMEYLAPGFKHTIGVDIDHEVLQMCRENIRLAGHSDKVTLMAGDVADPGLLTQLQADLVIYDIPFWYPHKDQNQGNLIDKNPPLQELMAGIRSKITEDIIIFSPPEWTYEYFLKELGEMEFEEVFIDGKHNRNQIYLGGLKKVVGKTCIELNTG